MKIRESCLQTGNFIYKPGISLTKQDFHLQRGSLGLQRGFSGYYLPRTNSMNEQIIILIFLVLALGATLWLYILKAKKQVEYKGDERWLTIQLKANQSANIANWTLIVLLAIATSVPLFIDIQIMFTLDRVILFGELFIGLRNLLELIAIMYFDKQL